MDRWIDGERERERERERGGDMRERISAWGALHAEAGRGAAAGRARDVDPLP